MNKPSLPKGTRDYLPDVMAKRNFIYDTIKSVYEKFGFQCIETPSMEKLSTLTGKYGDEGDQLIFKILNSGDFLKKTTENALINKESKKILPQISEKALRYDLTVPFARFVVQHQNELTFPFKRYQIQNVWRADRPQKGRYREFYQCDADVVGNDSLLYEIEFIQIYDEVLTRLGLKDFSIKMNNRKILAGLAEVMNENENLIPITVAIDKLDKIGEEGVLKELGTIELNEKAIEVVKALFKVNGTIDKRINSITDILNESEIGLKGIEELKFIISHVNKLGLKRAKLELDVTLARGLNYYTGTIFEVKTNEVKMGSICGGGRYDDLTGIFGLKGLSGVGISFGADRIYDVMEELDLFPEATKQGTQLLFVNFGKTELNQCLFWSKMLRDHNIKTEVYPDSSKMKKQMKYANDKKIPFVALVGTQEIKNDTITLKNMITGEQDSFSIEELIKFLN